MANSTSTRSNSTIGDIFKVIREHAPLYASDIVLRTGLAKSTISSYLNQLVTMGIVREEVPEGTKRRKYCMAESAGVVIGVDLNNTYIDVALCNLEASPLDQTHWEVDTFNSPPEEILDHITTDINDLLSRHDPAFPRLFGIGVGVPWPVDHKSGFPIAPPALYGWDHYPVGMHLREQLGCPVFIDNDANVLALAERDKGAAYDASLKHGDFLVIEAGLGISAGIIIKGEIYQGAKGVAGDIAHIAIEGNTTLCKCGKQGCLSAVAGGDSMFKRVAELARTGKSVFLADEIAKGEPITPHLIARGAASGDEYCLKLISNSGKYIGYVLSNIVTFFNPSLVIINGQLTGLGELFMSSIREAVYRRSTPLATADLIIRKSPLFLKARIIGSAILALDEIFTPEDFEKHLNSKIS